MWLSIVVFLSHELEEIATFSPWLRLNRSRLPNFAQPFAAMSTRQFSLGVAVLIIAFAIVTILAVRSLRHGRIPWLFLVMLGVLFANAMTHLGQAVYFRGYAPGLISAAAIVLPYLVFAARAFILRGLITVRQAFLFAAAGFALQPPIILVVLRFASES